ncbi:sensor histidine kinase [Thalassotalea fusca]
MNDKADVSTLIAELNEKQRQISQQLDLGNDKMRGLAKRVWRVQEDERKHIARELHDGVGQLLTALINQLQQTEQLSSHIDLTESITLARQALSDTRTISRLMRPRILDDLGLIPALEWLVRVMSESAEPHISFHHKVNGNINSDMQILAFRVIQEALTNAIKHARASLITLNVIASDNFLMIKVKDNGIGLEVQPDGAGFGLSAMEDRVNAFGGQLTIESEPGLGCEIKVLVSGR